jgi:outer membrane protein assembly factor BamA
MKYDFLIVGSGLFGSVFAHEATKAGKKCLIIEKRNHIGGNCYTENIDKINIHKYGPHIFHTNDKKIWDWIQQFGEFKITGNIEYRFNLYKFIKGAVFTDLGNVWLLNNALEKPGATIQLKTFGDEIAIGSGVGLRGDFTFFIFRLDAALKMKDPTKPTGSRWIAGTNNTKDITFNFGIGYPF